jgi:UDP-glucose 4-epimerase
VFACGGFCRWSRAVDVATNGYRWSPEQQTKVMLMSSIARSRCFVAGGAGFIGSNLVDRLLDLDCEVIAYDNFSASFPEFVATARNNDRFTMINGDILDAESLTASMRGCDRVFHFAANADVRFGLEHPEKDLQQNTIGTFNVLEAMRANGITRIGFSSTGSVYGEPNVIPTPEDAPFPIQTSLYAASKLAGEGLIQAYAEGYGFQAVIFRFTSILGERYSHGHVFDFYRKLLADPDRLHILGDGKQKKSYLYVQDCIDAILTAVDRCEDKISVFNLGHEGYVTVDTSAQIIARTLGLTPEFTYEGGERGWVGDNPFTHLDIGKISALGWHPKMTIEESVARTVHWMQANEWIFDRRQ